MLRNPVSLFAVIILMLGGPSHAEWHFAIPDGWVDVSPGAEIPPNVPEELAILAQSGIFHTYAIDLGSARNDGFAENLNAIVQERPLVVDSDSLEQWLASIPGQAAREVQGARVTFVEQSIGSIAGLPALRVVFDLQSPGLEMRSLQYLIPGGSTTAQLTYSASPVEFASFLPVFEAAAQRTEGAAPPPTVFAVGQALAAKSGLSGEDWANVLRYGGKMLGAALGFLIVSVFLRKK